MWAARISRHNTHEGGRERVVRVAIRRDGRINKTKTPLLLASVYRTRLRDYGRGGSISDLVFLARLASCRDCSHVLVCIECAQTVRYFVLGTRNTLLVLKPFRLYSHIDDCCRRLRVPSSAFASPQISRYAITDLGGGGDRRPPEATATPPMIWSVEAFGAWMGRPLLSSREEVGASPRRVLGPATDA